MKKEQLIKGRWYKVMNYSNVYYKFGNHEEKHSILMSLYKEGNMLRKDYVATNRHFWEKAQLATLDQLKNFLPINDPDLQFKPIYELW